MEHKKFTMKELPKSEQPYEKCGKLGAGALSDAELLAVIIRTGTREERSIDLAERILVHAGRQKGILGIHSLGLKEFMQIRGIGKVKAVQLLCIAELSKRLSKASMTAALTFTQPRTVAAYMMEELRHLKREQVNLLMFDTKGRLLKECVLSVGTINASMLSPREIFIEAFKAEAVHVILTHNHPSGDPSPSQEDILVTKRIQEAGTVLGIVLADHIIIGDNKYISFKESGYL